jgi:hypothetical protein
LKITEVARIILGIFFSIVPGTDVMILKMFSPKNSAKKLAFLIQNKAILLKIGI